MARVRKVEGGVLPAAVVMAVAGVAASVVAETAKVAQACGPRARGGELQQCARSVSRAKDSSVLTRTSCRCQHPGW